MSGVLSDWQLKKLDFIYPFVDSFSAPKTISFGASSFGYDVRIGYKYKVLKPSGDNCVIDPKNINPDLFVDVAKNKEDPVFVLGPNDYALGVSLEHFNLPANVIGICLGKSTYARCGLIVNVTPLEPEWHGFLTIELANPTKLPIRIYSGEGIAQIIFLQSDVIPNKSYKDKEGKYQGQADVTLPIVK